ncbi:MAG: PQQ-binding-like beta-propeller repeat protein [Frankiaceae bacterium]|nr:PQQ-binding-like beta-propeller repeat protein [Frankiaceae bacterium]
MITRRLLPVLACAALAAPGSLLAAAAHPNVGPCASSDPGGDWSTYGHDAANTRAQPGETALGPAQAATLAPAWTFTTTGALQSTPIVSGGCVYLTASSGIVYAVSAAIGRLVWQAVVPVVKPASTGGALPGAPAVVDGRVFVLAADDSKPFAEALDAQTGALLWRSQPITTQPGSYTNASAAVYKHVLVAGYSSAEGVSGGQGGVSLLDTRTGAILTDVPTIPPADQAKGYAGGGVWSTAAFDGHGFAYVGAGNPDSKSLEHPHTNAILKIDVKDGSPTFGRIVAAYKGSVDQYDRSLQALSQTPACAASDNTGTPWPLDDPVCGQLDLDFGASPNLIPDGHGGLLVGDLQKSGTYHVAHTPGMTAAWQTLVGGTCASCNAASTAYDGSSVYVIGTPGGVLWSLDALTGARKWTALVGDGIHYEPISTADGVVYTVDGEGFLDGWSAQDGSVVVKRSIATDVSTPVGGITSAGVAIADHTVFAATSDPSMSSGYLVAYRPAG